MRHQRTRAPRRRWPPSVLIAIGVVAMLLVLALSPLTLLAVDHFFPSDWGRLGNIGQAYGAVSALFAGVAVGGVSLSMVWQARQLRVSELQAQRMLQFEVMKLMINDPSLRAISPPSTGSSVDEWKMHIVTNLLFVSLLMGYEIREISPDSLRDSMRSRFDSPFGRRFWPRVRESYASNATTTLRQQFIHIVDEEHERAMAKHSSESEDARTASPTGHPGDSPSRSPAATNLIDQKPRGVPSLYNRSRREDRSGTPATNAAALLTVGYLIGRTIHRHGQRRPTH
jgi:hypothetical protein